MAIIGKINVDFTVLTDFSPTELIVGDKSTWNSAENLPATISITPPGSIKPINNTFQKNKLNIFHSVNLGLSCVTPCGDQDYHNLPDGIWKITVSSAYEGLDKTRYYLKTDNFTLEEDKIYIKSGLEYDKNKKQFREDLEDINFLIRVASAHTRRGDFYKANRDFTEAQKLLKKYSECKNCI